MPIEMHCEDEGPKNNRYSGSYAATVLSGPRLSMTLKLVLFNRSSHKKYHEVLSSVLITWKAYTGIAARGYVHRLVNHGEKQYSNGKGNHIDGLEGFWGYLKRKHASKGGILKERLHLLGEYVWRYYHRSDSERKKMRRHIQ